MVRALRRGGRRLGGEAVSVLWHIVKFHFGPGLADDDRVAFEDALWSLADTIDTLRLVRVARAVGEPEATGLFTAFDDESGLAAFRDHPSHTPVIERAKALCTEIVRLDMHTPDDPGALPLVP